VGSEMCIRDRYGIYSIQDRVCPELQQLSGSFPPGILVEAYVNAGFAYLIIPITLALVFAWVYDRLSERNLYWIAQTAILFPVLLTFRSFGSILSQFVLNTILLLVLAGLTRLFDLRQRARARGLRTAGSRPSWSGVERLGSQTPLSRGESQTRVGL